MISTALSANRFAIFSPVSEPLPLGVDVNTTIQEYLRSLQRVTVRFHIDAFAGEFVGDAAVELFENCGCTLFALVCATCEQLVL